MKQINYKKLILPNIPYVFFVYLFDKVGQAVRLAPGADISAKILNITQGFSAAFENALPSVYPLDLLVGIVGAVIIRLIVYVKGKNAKKYRKGAEYGSARWGNAEDIKPYIDPDFQNNIILTQTERLTMNSRPKQPKYARNKNVVVIGGSGSGKTRFFVKPNLMQLHSSYVLTDPKGTVLIECGKLLQRAGYRIKVLNTINFKKSMHYNPFVYIRSEKDILKLVNTLIANTKGEGEKSAEDFWVKAERLLYCALVGYIWYEAPAEEMNFITLLELINASEAREDDEEYQSPVDLLFADLEERDPDHFAVKQYRKYKLAAGKTAKSILISCGARLAPFDIKELRDLMSYDELELDTLGDRKTALFLIMSDTDSTFNFVIAMLQSQLFNLLCDKADDEYGGKLPVHVRCLLDEFANIGQIPQFEKLIATIRSREISASIILQSQSQLKAIYKDAAEIILDNADSTLFLGGRGKNAKDISENLGRETIDSFNTSENRGTQVSHGLNYQKLGKELMTQDEIAVMDGGKCILQLRGVRPFLSDKYDITKHPNYKYLSDFDKKNAFDLDTWIFFKWIFKTFVAVLLVTNTWNIVMGVFDVTQSVVNQSAGVIISDTSIDVTTVITDIEAKLDAMSVGGLLGLWFQSLFVGLTMKALSICIMLVVYGRMIEIYLVTSVAPIPMATMVNHEWGSMGQNYLKSLLALGFQAFLILVCVGIYAVLIQTIAATDDISGAIWACMGYTVLLCFTLFKTGSLAKSVFSAH